VAYSSGSTGIPPVREAPGQFFANLLWDGFIFGGLSGTFGVLVGHPFDTLKLRMQTSAAGPESLASAARTVLRTEGLRGLFKGAFSISLGQAPINAMIFGANHFATSVLRDSQRGAALSMAQLYACGTFSGLMQSLILSPFELLKVQQQLHGVGCKGDTLGFREVSREIVSKFGVLGLYRGMASTMVRAAAAALLCVCVCVVTPPPPPLGTPPPFNPVLPHPSPQIRDGPTFGFYFSAYEYCQHSFYTLLRRASPAIAEDTATLSAALPAGAIAGAISWVVALPADVIKSNIQGAPLDTPLAQLKFSRVASRIYAQSGVQGFFRGLWPCVLRSLPVNAVTFFLLEWLRACKREYLDDT
jgi:solute carrier family 25 carnitine/acylcarnitine transporter 20/29